MHSEILDQYDEKGKTHEVPDGFVIQADFDYPASIKIYDRIIKKIVDRRSNLFTYRISLQAGDYGVSIRTKQIDRLGKKKDLIKRYHFIVGDPSKLRMIAELGLGGVQTSKGVRYNCPVGGCGMSTFDKVAYFNHLTRHEGLTGSKPLEEASAAMAAMKRKEKEAALKDGKGKKAMKDVKTNLSPEEAKALAMESTKE